VPTASTRLKNDTNARNFAGLNFDRRPMVEGIRYAHARAQVLMAINTFRSRGREADWRAAVDGAADLGVDAVILADIGLLDYAASATRAAPAPVGAGFGDQLRSGQFLPTASSACSAPCCRAC
jgi:collagenase-like PrtC family protease